jgi:transposase
MNIDIQNLPLDIKSTHKIIVALSKKNALFLVEIQSLKDQLALLKALRFGKSSEKLNKQISELESKIEDNEIEAFKSVRYDTESANKDRQKPKRKKLPDHLPREENILNPDPECASCGGTEFRTIGKDASELLEYVKSSLKVIRNIRPRCVCIKCDNIVQAYAPSNPISKGKAGPGLLSHVLIQKYCNHLPFYRQSEMFDREGIDISRSTMSSWAGKSAKLLESLVAEIKRYILNSTHIHTDDTTIKVLAPGAGKTKTGRLWTYVKDGRPHGEKEAPAVYYSYTPDRKGIRPEEHLKNYQGILHADAYGGYDRLYPNENNPDSKILEAACWAHTRRKFYEVTVANNNAIIATIVLEQMSDIYKIEATIKGLDPGERLKERQKKSKILVEEFFKTIKIELIKLPQKGSTAKAIRYALNNQEALMRFLDDGKIEIDNNAAERSMRSIALGRKNWMFAGSDDGGSTAAIFYTIIETAKLNNVNPELYLKKVLDVIQDYNSNKLVDLLPWNLKL